jgi:hypothetical protein
MEEVKVIFLDIDGVLQPHGRQNRFKHMDGIDELTGQLNRELDYDFDYIQLCKESRFASYDIMAVYYDWDMNSVELLSRLLDEEGAKIVLSTDWREKGDDVMKALFAIHHLEKYWYGATDYEPEQYREITDFSEEAKKQRQSDWDTAQIRMEAFKDLQEKLGEKHYPHVIRGWNDSDYLDFRTVEIREYLDRHPEITDHVTLDDRNISYGLDGHAVITHNIITEKDFHQAQAILRQHDGPYPLPTDVKSEKLDAYRKLMNL